MLQFVLTSISSVLSSHHFILFRMRLSVSWVSSNHDVPYNIDEHWISKSKLFTTHNILIYFEANFVVVETKECLDPLILCKRLLFRLCEIFHSVFDLLTYSSFFFPPVSLSVSFTFSILVRDFKIITFNTNGIISSNTEFLKTSSFNEMDCGDFNNFYQVQLCIVQLNYCLKEKEREKKIHFTAKNCSVWPAMNRWKKFKNQTQNIKI